jgi:hypothetical protein
MFINSRIISRGHATNYTSGATTESMNAAVFLKKGDVVRIIGLQSMQEFRKVSGVRVVRFANISYHVIEYHRVSNI